MDGGRCRGLGPPLGLARESSVLAIRAPGADRDAATYKLSVVKRFVRDRAAAWVDDELGEDVIAWADQRKEHTILVHCDPRTGITDEYVHDLLVFAAAHHASGRGNREGSSADFACACGNRSGVA